MSKFSGSVIVCVHNYFITDYKSDSLFVIGEHPDIRNIVDFDFEIVFELQDYLNDLIPSAIEDLGFMPFELQNGYYHVYFSGYLEEYHNWDGIPDCETIVEDINFYFLAGYSSLV